MVWDSRVWSRLKLLLFLVLCLSSLEIRGVPCCYVHITVVHYCSIGVGDWRAQPPLRFSSFGDAHYKVIDLKLLAI